MYIRNITCEILELTSEHAHFKDEWDISPGKKFRPFLERLDKEESSKVYFLVSEARSPESELADKHSTRGMVV